MKLLLADQELPASTMSPFFIGSRAVTVEQPFVIAEIAQAHDGSLGLAHAYIDAVADAGVDAVKFQTHLAAAESTPAEPWRIKFSPQDDSRYAYWQRMEFTALQWAGLARHARDRDLVFLSSPFSFAAVDLLERLEMPAWKIASGEMWNLPMIARLAATRRPVLLSSGMSSWAEISAAVELCRTHAAPFALFQCTTAYPCPPEAVGLNVIPEIRRRFDCPVGLSDHSGEVFAGLAAAALGAMFFEVHVTFDKRMFGPDVPASLDLAQLRTLADGVRAIAKMHANPVEKDVASGRMADLRRNFGKSIVAARDLAPGHRLTEADLTFKKPGFGLPPAEMANLLGRRVRRNLSANSVILIEDTEPASAVAS